MAEVHGRSHAYLHVFSKPEICTGAELTSIPETVTVSSEAADVHILTERFSVDEPLVLDGSVKPNKLRGVRRTPVSADASTWPMDYFYDLFGSSAQNAVPQRSLLSAAGFFSGLALLARSQIRASSSAIFRDRDASPGRTADDANPDQPDNVVLLLLAALCDDIDELERLLDSGTPPASSQHGWTALHMAAVMGHTPAIRCILQHAASQPVLAELINARTDGLMETPLHLAAAYAPREQQVPCFQLISSFAPTEEPFAHLTQRNVIDETLVHRAAVSDNASLIELILGAVDRRNTSHNQSEELHSVVEMHRATFVRQVDYKDRFCRTPLWHAAAVGACTAISSLARLGAALNFSDDEGLTPLHAACREGKADAAETLISLGAVLHIPTHYLDFTPLHFAALCGHADCIRVLIARGASVNSGAGIKPIHLAAASGSMDCVRALTSARAWCNLPSLPVLKPKGNGEYGISGDSAGSAAEIADLCGHPEISEHIKSVEEARAAQQQQQQQQHQGTFAYTQAHQLQGVSETGTFSFGPASYGGMGGPFGRAAPFLMMSSSRTRPAPGYGNLLARPPLPQMTPAPESSLMRWPEPMSPGYGPAPGYAPLYSPPTSNPPAGWPNTSQVQAPNDAYPQFPIPAYNHPGYQIPYPYAVQSHPVPAPTGQMTLQESQRLERELRAAQAHRDARLDQWSEGAISQRDITQVLNDLSMYEGELQRQTQMIQMVHELQFQNGLREGAVLYSDNGQPILELE